MDDVDAEGDVDGVDAVDAGDTVDTVRNSLFSSHPFLGTWCHHLIMSIFW